MEGLKTIGDMFRSNYKEQVRLKETAVKGKRHTSNSTKKVKHLFLDKAKIFKQRLQKDDIKCQDQKMEREKSDAAIIRHSTDDKRMEPNRRVGLALRR